GIERFPVRLIPQLGAKKTNRQSLCPCMSLFADDITVCVSAGSSFGGYRVEASLISPTTGLRRAWTVHRTDYEFDTLNGILVNEFGSGLLPPLPSQRASALEYYLRRLLKTPRVVADPILREFLDVPADVSDGPALFAEVVTGDMEGVNLPSADPTKPRIVHNDKRGTPGPAVAGAVVGALLGGPFGALMGSLAGSAAAGRDDTVGEVAKSAGAVADAALEKARQLEREYSVSERAGQAARKAVTAAQRVDREYNVRQKASRAAQKAKEAAQRVDDEFNIREKTKNAFRSVGSALKR
ncbi:unnamed protein product, partial [Choristocarpus tenellus]